MIRANRKVAQYMAIAAAAIAIAKAGNCFALEEANSSRYFDQLISLEPCACMHIMLRAVYRDHYREDEEAYDVPYSSTYWGSLVPLNDNTRGPRGRVDPPQKGRHPPSYRPSSLS